VKSLWQEPVRREVLERLTRLTPAHRPSWGRFTAPQAVAHLADALRMAFGDLPTAPKRLPFRHPPLKQFAIYWMPFPKGAPTARELVARPPGEWRAELAACRDLVERFGRETRARAWPDHPAFGRMSARSWGVVAYRHVDHHLRQFGV